MVILMNDSTKCLHNILVIFPVMFHYNEYDYEKILNIFVLIINFLFHQ